MERYLSSKLAANLHFYYLKNSVRIDLKKHIKHVKVLLIEDGWKYRKI